MPRPVAAASRRDLLKQLAAGAGAFAWGGHAHAAPAMPPAIRDKGYRLVQDWDFGANVTDDKALRNAFFTRYIYNDGKQDALNDEWQRYRDNGNHVFEDAALALVARAPTGVVAPGKIESGMLRSKWSGQYGYFECRMKVPGERGMWPAFWLNPEDKKWPPEIDIMEMVNNGRDTTRNTFHFVHSGVPEAKPVASSLLNNNKTYKPGIDFKDDFHTYAAEWTAERVRHFVDDVLVVDREFRWVHRDGSDGGPAHVLVNLAVGGKWPGNPPGPEAFPVKLLLKHIRVWQR